jgi:hypothetical protein
MQAFAVLLSLGNVNHDGWQKYLYMPRSPEYKELVIKISRIRMYSYSQNYYAIKTVVYTFQNRNRFVDAMENNDVA